jgi:hypothetical protein
MAAAAPIFEPVPKRNPHDIRLVGVTQPVKGTGSVYYYPTNSAFAAAKIGFKAESPWSDTGRLPFAWQLIVPEYASDRPTIRIVASRDVWIIGEATVPLSELGPDEPYLEIVRIQSVTGVPDLELNLEQPYFLHQQIVRPPYRWVEGMLLEELEPSRIEYGGGSAQIVLEHTPPPDAHIASVVTRPNGVDFIDGRGDWKFSLTVPDDRPAAFAYEIHVPPWARLATRRATVRHPGFFLRVVRTREVKVDTWVTFDPRDSDHSQITVDEAVAANIDEVPSQGSELLKSGLDFSPFRFEEKHIRWSRRIVDEFNTIIGLIPVVGSIYDIAQFIYARQTGKDFYKWEVSDDDMIWLGVGAVLGFLDVVPVGKIAGKLAKTLKNAPVKDIQKVVSPEFGEALGRLRREDGEAMAAMLERYARKELSLAQLLKEIGDVFDLRMAAQFDEDVLRRVFAPDYSGFAHTELDSLYRAYVARNSPSAVHPLEWVKRTRGRSQQLLTQLLGSDYVDKINEGLIHKRILTVSAADLTQYAGFLKKSGAIGAHSDLVEIKTGLGHLFESDHLVERRFTRDTGLDPDEQHAVIVPRNPHVATQMKQQGYNFYYIHSSKTTALRRLIPHGAENMFTPQQWWEAHVFAYKAAGAPDEIIANELKFDFDLIRRDLDEEIDLTIRDLPDSHFLQENGWGPAVP